MYSNSKRSLNLTDFREFMDQTRPGSDLNRIRRSSENPWELL